MDKQEGTKGVKRKEDPPRRRSPVSPPASLPSSSNGTLLELDLARTGLACDLGAALPPLVEAAPRLRALDASGNAVTGTPAALAAALAWVEAAHGSVEAYLERHGFGAGEQAALRAALAPP